MRFLPKLILLDSKNSIAWIFSAISWLCFGKNYYYFDIMTVFCILPKLQVYLSFVRPRNKTAIGSECTEFCPPLGCPQQPWYFLVFKMSSLLLYLIVCLTNFTFSTGLYLVSQGYAYWFCTRKRSLIS